MPPKRRKTKTPLLAEAAITAFNMDAINKGDLIRAQYKSWPEPRNGLVASVSAEKLTVLFLPGLGNVSNYFPIRAAEVEAGSWHVLWTTNLRAIKEHGEEA